MCMYYKTYKFRVKDSKKRKLLKKLAGTVNYVWNQCNAISRDSWFTENEDEKVWVSKFDMQNKFAGQSKELGINSACIQLVTHEHAKCRKQFKKAKLNWRTAKRCLGWIPFDTRNLTLVENGVKFQKKIYHLWQHREIQGKFKFGCFTQNAKGEWFVSLVCEEHINEAPKTGKAVGVDLGFKEVAVTSDGEHFEHPKPLRKYQEKLAKAQRADNKKQVTNLHNKIKNIRKDFNHKLSTKLVKAYDQIFVGNTSPTPLMKKGKRFAKLATDASWGQFRTMLEYKANRLGRVLLKVPEAWSTVTCSDCGSRCGPSGLSSLGVRSWTCDSCGAKHERDVNAAINILNFGFGHETPLGSPCL